VRVRQLTRRLRAAEQQDREQRPLVGREGEMLVEDLVVLQCPAPGVGPHDPQQPAFLERLRGPLDDLLVEVGDGVAAARLVARRHQCVRGEGIGGGYGRLLLQQAAEDALVSRIEDGEFAHVTTLGPLRSNARPEADEMGI
jgi:hypothetical protein